MDSVTINRLRSMLAFLRRLAELTPTKVDDAVVALGESIAEDETLGRWFRGVNATAGPEGTLQLIGEPPAEVVEAFRNRGFEFSKVLEFLPLLIQVLGAFK